MGLSRNENEDKYGVKLILQSFEGRHAILAFEDKEAGTIKWPIHKLPNELKEGDKVTIKIQDNEEEYQMKRRLLEELVN
jgi:hypothetical protein